MKHNTSFQHLVRVPEGPATVKHVFEIDDVRAVEAIAFTTTPLPAEYQEGPVSAGTRGVVCISSQAGCNIGCTFCATGRERNYRNLQPDEMVMQARLAAQGLSETCGVSVTFSGMGEPLLNLKNVIRAANELCTDHGFEYASISTIVIPEALRKLADERPDTHLFVSLHATEDELRRRLIPSRACYPIAEVLEAARAYRLTAGRRVKVSYLLLGGVNDSLEAARRLAALAPPDDFVIQLLLWNQVKGMPFERVTDEQAELFALTIREEGSSAYVMPSAGRKVAGGCGQLAGALTGGDRS